MTNIIEDTKDNVTSEFVELNSLTKDELINIIIKLRQDAQVTKDSKASGRKEQVLAILRREEQVTISQIAEELNINDKNVSSQLCYLRKDNHVIYSIRINNVTNLKLVEDK